MSLNMETPELQAQLARVDLDTLRGLSEIAASTTLGAAEEFNGAARTIEANGGGNDDSPPPPPREPDKWDEILKDGGAVNSGN